MKVDYNRFPFSVACLTAALAASGVLVLAQQPQQLPNMGQQITPLAPKGGVYQTLNPGLLAPADQWLVSNAVTSVVSPEPEHKTMLVMSSGYNRFNTAIVQPP